MCVSRSVATGFSSSETYVGRGHTGAASTPSDGERPVGLPERTAEQPRSSTSRRDARLVHRPIRWRWLIALLLIGFFAWLFSPLGLHRVGALLVVDEEDSDFDCVLILGGDRRYEEAANLYAAHPEIKILSMRSRPTRIVRLGIIEDPEVVMCRELEELGVTRGAIEIIESGAPNRQGAFSALSGWMRKHPESRIRVLCDRFASRRVRYVLDSVLDRQEAERIAISALEDRRFSEVDWLKSRKGAKRLAFAYLRLAHSWCWSEPYEPPPEWDVAKYEGSLRSKFVVSR